MIYDHQGNPFESEKDMCGYYKIEYGTYRYRFYKLGWNKEKALTYRKIVKDHLGNEFDSVYEMCNHYNIEVYNYYYRIRSGWTKEEALTLGLKGKRTVRGNSKTIKYIIEGKEFYSINAVCKEYRIDYKRVNRLMSSGKSLEEIVRDTLNKRKYRDIDGIQVTCQGIKYNSIKKFANSFGLEYARAKKLAKQGYNGDQILKIYKSESVHRGHFSVTVFGEKYDSISDAIYKINRHIDRSIYCRIIQRLQDVKWDIELIIALPPLGRIDAPYLKFIGLDGQARYIISWSNNYVTTREIIEHERPDLISLYDKAHPDGKWNPYKRGG